VEVKPGYRRTEVGVIPEDWAIRRIDAVSKLINGRGFKPFEWQKTGLPIIRIQNLNGSDDFNFYSGTFDKKLEVEPGQLLFAWSGSRGTSFGPHIWKGPFGVLNYHTWKVQIRESDIHKEYFLHALRQLTTFIEGHAHGASALVHVQKWQMESFLLGLPPTKAEQEAIAEALSDADALIESLEQLITKKRHLKQGTMQELLTGKKRLPEFRGKPGYTHTEAGVIPEDWRVERVDQIANVGRGRVISHKEIAKSLSPKYPVYSSQTSDNGVMGYMDTFDFDHLDNGWR
jgi:type I restriction enzyme S subunit